MKGSEKLYVVRQIHKAMIDLLKKQQIVELIKSITVIVFSKEEIGGKKPVVSLRAYSDNHSGLDDYAETPCYQSNFTTIIDGDYNSKCEQITRFIVNFCYNLIVEDYG